MIRIFQDGMIHMYRKMFRFCIVLWIENMLNMYVLPCNKSKDPLLSLFLIIFLCDPSIAGNHLGHQQWPISLDVAACSLHRSFYTDQSLFWGMGDVPHLPFFLVNCELFGKFNWEKFFTEISQQIFRIFLLHPMVINGGFENSELHFNTETLPILGWGKCSGPWPSSGLLISLKVVLYLSPMESAW